MILGERQGIAQTGVHAIEARQTAARNNGSAAKPMFAISGCQQISVSTFLCDALGLAELYFPVSSRNPAKLAPDKEHAIAPSAPKMLQSKLSKHLIWSCSPLHDKKLVSKMLGQVTHFLFMGQILANIKYMNYKNLGMFVPVMQRIT